MERGLTLLAGVKLHVREMKEEHWSQLYAIHGVLRALVDRGFVAEVGREETPGRPVLYGTTPEFLERLGLPSLSELPSLAPLLSRSAEDAPAED